MMRSEVTARMAMPMAISAGKVKPSHENTRGNCVSSFFLIASTIFGSQYNWSKKRRRSRNAANTERTANLFPQSVVKHIRETLEMEPDDIDAGDARDAQGDARDS